MQPQIITTSLSRCGLPLVVQDLPRVSSLPPLLQRRTREVGWRGCTSSRHLHPSGVRQQSQPNNPCSTSSIGRRYRLMTKLQAPDSGEHRGRCRFHRRRWTSVSSCSRSGPGSIPPLRRPNDNSQPRCSSSNLSASATCPPPVRSPLPEGGPLPSCLSSSSLQNSPVAPLRPRVHPLITSYPLAPNPLIIFTRRSDSPTLGGPIPFTFHYEPTATIPTIELLVRLFFFPFSRVPFFPRPLIFLSSFFFFLLVHSFCTVTPPFSIVQSRTSLYSTHTYIYRISNASKQADVRTMCYTFPSSSVAWRVFCLRSMPGLRAILPATGRCMCSPRLEWYLGISACVLPDAAPRSTDGIKFLDNSDARSICE